MELLAPAGSKESFIAAVRGGANSVYVGIQGFNARQYAKNLSLYDLEALIGHAHDKGAKVFVTFNTLVKQWEMDEAVAALASIEKLGPDGIIVQDMGVARIVRECFPGLELHASTQMAVHNGQGAAELAGQGFKRVVLARELSFSELKLIAAKSPVDLEIFCHRALCFSVSGMCLFSSAIGGQSGNRGRCTQPCRRIWGGKDEKGYLFSPRDLQLLEQLPKLRSLGVKALKIEGRMRSSDYVYRVVKAYRTLLDADKNNFNDALGEAQELLAVDYARAKTTALFAGRDSKLFSPGEAQCLGVRIGEVAACGKESITIDVFRPLERGDRLRLSDPKTDQAAVIKVKDVSSSGKRCDLPYTGPAFAKGVPVFLVGDAQSDERSFKKEVDRVFDEFAKQWTPDENDKDAAKPHAVLLANRWSRKAEAERLERLWVRIDDPAWLALLPFADPAAKMDIVLSLNKDNLNALQRAGTALRNFENVICELTPYIGQREVAEFRRAIEALSAAGVSRWIVNNVGHFKLFKERPTELIAGPFLYTWNAYAAVAWKDLGVSRFVASWEDEVLNIKELCRLALRGHLAVFLYGHPPLSRSRMLTPEMCGGDGVEEKPGQRFRKVYESGSGVVLAEQPVSLFNAREKLSGYGIDTFGIDLSYIAPDARRWREIFDAYASGVNPDESIKFNFKRGVK